MLPGGSISLLAGALMRMAHRLLLCAGLLAVAATTLYLAAQEAQSARLQAGVPSELARSLRFTVGAGRSEAIRFPGSGPYDQRRGYTQLPAFIERLTARDYDITAQARMSPRMLAFDQHGLFPTYRESNQAGLALLDCRGEPLHAERFPQRVYERFDAVPPLLVDALLFIENRELLEPGSPRRNPAVEWDRLANAVLGRARRTFDAGHPAPGGSTLATQIEKYRHSPEGRTDSLSDKLRQMASASLRAYLDGEHTLARRRQIVVDYLDTVPLSAQAGSGEVNGLGDAMWAWYGRDFDETNRLLSDAGREALWLPASLQRRTGLILGPATLQQQAVAFKQALSLLVAQRRPSHYLVAGQADLAALTDSHLRLLAEAGVISAALRDAALPVRLRLLPHSPMEISPFAWRKATATTRSRLSALLDVPRAYDLDRLDLTVVSSVDGQVQRDVTRRLRALKDRAAAKAAGLYGFHLLNESDDPGRLSFSVSLYERGERTNLLRVQTDSGDQPFDINEGARLDMGSTAKLRTLVSYLELVAELHERWSALDGDALAAVAVHPQDALGRWARGYLARATDRSLAAMLEAAMERRFSASPAETFRTGGGLHRFVNFDHADDSRMLSVREALKHSVNLVFIRLMRDVVQRHIHAEPNAAGVTHPGLGEAARREQLERFADAEGQVFITRFLQSVSRAPRSAVAQRRRAAGRDAPAGAVAAGIPAQSAASHPRRGAGRQPARTPAGLRVAVQDAPRQCAGSAHPQPAGGRGLRADSSHLAAAGLSVRFADAVVCDGDRCLGRPAGRARRTDGDHCQRWLAAASAEGGVDGVRTQHAVRDPPRIPRHRAAASAAGGTDANRSPCPGRRGRRRHGAAVDSRLRGPRRRSRSNWVARPARATTASMCTEKVAV